jgi:hypothetical protein
VRSTSVRAGVAGLGVAVLAVICCAAAPLAFALAGTLTVGAILGASAGLGALAVLGGLALAIRHRRRACQLRSSRGRRS